MNDSTFRERLLLKEFDQRFEEKVIHMQHYHRQTDLLQLYTTFVFGVIGAMLVPAFQNVLVDRLSQSQSHLLIFLILVYIILLAEYLLFNILASWVIIFRNALRCKELEEELNELCGSPALMWDSVIAPPFYDVRGPLPRLTRFDLFKTLTVAGILIVVLCAIDFISHSITPEYFAPMVGFSGILIVLNIYQLSRLPRLIRDIDNLTTSLSEQKKLEM